MYSNDGEKVADLARVVLNLADAKLRDEHFYASVPLCVIDAVFSIGVNYVATRRTVLRWASRQNPAWPIDRRTSSVEHTVSDLLAALGDRTDLELALGQFGNRQRTSSRNGILKAEAVRLFALALKEAGIDSFADLEDSEKVGRAEAMVKTIKGQRSGISFDYFALLAGHELVKADRMVCRFVADALGLHEVGPTVAKQAVLEAAAILARQFPHVTPRLLDSEIWGYQSAKGRQRGRVSGTKRDTSPGGEDAPKLCGTPGVSAEPVVIRENGGRTRDRTLDLSRVKGTLSR